MHACYCLNCLKDTIISHSPFRPFIIVAVVWSWTLMFCSYNFNFRKNYQTLCMYLLFCQFETMYFKKKVCIYTYIYTDFLLKVHFIDSVFSFHLVKRVESVLSPEWSCCQLVTFSNFARCDCGVVALPLCFSAAQEKLQHGCIII